MAGDWKNADEIAEAFKSGEIPNLETMIIDLWRRADEQKRQAEELQQRVDELEQRIIASGA